MGAQRLARASSTHAAATSRKGSVMVSRDRLDQLLQSEISHFALKQARPFALTEILSQRNRQEFSNFLHEELPVRFASRIKLLESIEDFDTEPFLLDTRNMYIESFKQMRMSDATHFDDFVMMLRNLKKRHANVVPLLITGIRELRSRTGGKLTVSYVDEFLNNFFLSRIGTEMLTSIFLQMAGNAHPKSFINEEGDILSTVMLAANDAEKLCHYHYGLSPGMVVWKKDLPRIANISQYLYYILFELFKNSIRASVENFRHINPTAFQELATSSASSAIGADPPDSASSCLLPEEPPRPGIIQKKALNAAMGEYPMEGLGLTPYHFSPKDPRLPTLQVIITGDENEVAIKLADQGGGIERSVANKIWSYLYTTARSAPIQYTVPTKMTKLPKCGTLDLPTTETCSGGDDGKTLSPLAGFGCGLPLSKLYAEYLGGSLNVVSMPHYGCDSYLFLNRVSNLQERLPPPWQPPTKKANLGIGL